MPKDCPDILILGGGPAGLAVASVAADRGYTVRVLEAAPAVGGNARTIEIDRIRYDTGAHRFHAKSDRATAWFSDLMEGAFHEVDAPSAIVDDGRFTPFPLGLTALLSSVGAGPIAASATSALVHRFRSALGRQPESFRSMALARYGRPLAERYLLRYSGKLWGIPLDRLDPRAAGGRLKGLTVRSILAELLGRRTDDQHMEGRFLYPTTGIGDIWDRVVERIPDSAIALNSPVTRLNHTRNEIVSVETATGMNESAPVVVSTLPLPLLVHLLAEPHDRQILERAASLRFRSLRLFFIGIARRSLTRFASLYVSDPSIPFTRLYESTNRSRSMAPEGMTGLCLELPCSPGDRWFEASTDEVVRVAKDYLKEIWGVRSDEIMHVEEHRLQNAYPVLELGVEDVVEELREFTGRFRNLHLVGRNQLFRYVHIHNLVDDAFELVDRLDGLRQNGTEREGPE